MTRLTVAFRNSANAPKMLSFDALSRTALTVCDVQTEELNLRMESAA